MKIVATTLSKYTSTPAIHFLAGELPIEGKLHRDMFSLFYSIWKNPHMKIFSIVKYLLETSSINSKTFSIRLRQISQMYEIEDPLTSLSKDLPSKPVYKEYILTKITAFHERELRFNAEKNSRMKYLVIFVAVPTLQ